MTNSEALRIVAMLTAYFRQELSNETAMLWAEGITGFELRDAMEATRLLGQANRFMPSLGEFKDAITEARNDRLAVERMSRPLPGPRIEYMGFAEFLRKHPGERNKVRRMGGPMRDLANRIEAEEAE